MTKLILGDCLEQLKSIPDNSIDLILADPPYGTTACKWDSVIPFVEMWKQLKRVRKERSVTALFGSEPFSSNLRMSNIAEFKYDFIWKKSRSTGFLQSKIAPLKAHEIISIFKAGKAIYYPQKSTGHSPTNSAKGDGHSPTFGKSKPRDYKGGDTTRFPISVLDFKCERGLHPTQKPVSLLEYLVKTYTQEGQTVLDFTMGSGSTGVACKNLGRKFIGIEKESKYYYIAGKRLGKSLLELDLGDL